MLAAASNAASYAL